MNRYDLQPLLTAMHTTTRDACDHLGISGHVRNMMLRTGLTDRQADLYATRGGFHPAEIWLDWFDRVEQLPTCLACGDTFAPSSPMRLYCTDRCKWRHKERERRARRKVAA